MRYSFAIFITFIMFQVSSVAHSQSEGELKRVVIVTPEDCLLLEQHIPDDDVKYRPDVDVRGRATVPAEIKSGNSLGIGEGGFSFYMTHDALKDNEIAKSLGLDQAQEGKMILGRVTVTDGEVLWNGAPLAGGQRERLYILCNEQ